MYECGFCGEGLKTNIKSRKRIFLLGSFVFFVIGIVILFKVGAFIACGSFLISYVLLYRSPSRFGLVCKMCGCKGTHVEITSEADVTTP